MALMTVDIGGSAIKYAFLVHGKLENKGSVETPLSRKAFLDSLITIQKSYTGSTPLKGCAISCPGDVDESTGIVGGISFAPFLHLTPILSEIETALNLPVSMFNDANCAALAELTQGVAKGMKEPLFIIIGSGIGVALCKEGQVMIDGSKLADKGNKVLADLIRLFKGLSASPVQSARMMSLKKLEGLSAYDGKDMFDFAEEGDADAINQIESMYQSLAEICYLLNVVIQPECIILGGGITNNPSFLDDIQIHLDHLIENKGFLLTLISQFPGVETPEQEQIQLKLCSLKNDANLIGAAVHFQEQQSKNALNCPDQQISAS